MSAPDTTPNTDAGWDPIILPLLSGDGQGEGGGLSPPLDRFAFPALPGPPMERATPELRRGIWPECPSALTARACSELAESVGGQLPADRSAVIAFTSPNDGDGTSRLLISLAPELARRRPGGLLVADGDFHRAGLTKRLSISRPQLGGMSSPVVYATNVAGLSVLPIPTAIRADAIAGQAEDLLNRCAGANQMFALESIPGLPNTAPWVDSGSGNVGEIVTHQRSTGGCRAKHRGPAVRIDPSWIDRLREDWPLVLLDVVSLEHADAWPTLEQCDAAYLVVCIGRTKRPAVRRAVSTFRSRGIRLLGCVALIPVGPDAEQ